MTSDRTVSTALGAAIIALGIAYAGYAMSKAQPRYQFEVQGPTLVRLDIRTGEIVGTDGKQAVVVLKRGNEWDEQL